MGSAKDIVEHCGVPRFVFSDFPLGNSAGKPHDPTSQRDTLSLALQILETATQPRTSLRSAQQWAKDSKWKDEFFSIEHLSALELAQRRAAFDQVKVVARDVKNKTRESS